MQPVRVLLPLDLSLADVTERRWAGDPTVLLLALVPLAGWTGYLAWLGRPLPALALAGIVAAVALAGST